jgi:protein-disulfide isomerase/uncharacterized membrane protein
MRALALVALATSVALLIDYTNASQSFCGPGSGCAAVRKSGFGYVVGIPVPVFGVLGFAFLFALTLGKSESVQSFLRPVSYVASLTAVALIGLQAKIGHFCALCLIVDGCAVAIGVVAYLRSRAPVGKGAVLRTHAWVALALIAIAAPYVWSLVKPNPKLPAAIARLYQPDKINIVEFADFECPFCRALHPTLKKLINERPGKVNFARLNMPLDRHPNAMDAAKGAVCGEEQGKKDEMADALFESEDLTPRGVQRIAATLHLDMPKFKECVASPNTTARIEREKQILQDAGFQGLPTTYVGDAMLVGAHPDEAAREAVFREAIDDAARGQGGGGVPSWLYVLAVAALVGVTIGVGRER